MREQTAAAVLSAPHAKKLHKGTLKQNEQTLRRLFISTEGCVLTARAAIGGLYLVFIYYTTFQCTCQEGI